MTLRINQQNLLIAQAKACMSNSDLVDASGLSRSGLLQVLNGARKPRPETVGKLAKALQVDVTEIIDVEEA